jgi:hypothetical protein
MSKIRGFLNTIIHFSKATSFVKGIFLAIFLVPILFVLAIKAIQVFIPFTYIGF